MDLHQNARLTFRSRETLANKIMIEKVTFEGGCSRLQRQPQDRRQVAPPLSHPGSARLAGSFLATAP